MTVVSATVATSVETNRPSNWYTLYPVTPTLSVDGNQVSTAPVEPTEPTEPTARFVGADGGALSVEVTGGGVGVSAGTGSTAAPTFAVNPTPPMAATATIIMPSRNPTRRSVEMAFEAGMR